MNTSYKLTDQAPYIFLPKHTVNQITKFFAGGIKKIVTFSLVGMKTICCVGNVSVPMLVPMLVCTYRLILPDNR